MIALTMYMLRYFIIIPFIKSGGLSTAISDFNFAILVLSTLFIAAAGYIINDYFDMRIDRVNRDGNIIVGHYVSAHQAMMLHTIFNIAGFIAGLYVAIVVGSIKLVGIQLVIPFILFFYSLKYKRLYLTGNLVVSILTSFIIIMVWLYEFFALKSEGFIIASGQTNSSLYFILFSYAIFAFLISMIREIVKDMEDMKGDALYKCRTLPIVSGKRKASRIVTGIIILCIILTVYIQYLLYEKNFLLLFWYLVFPIQVLFIYLIYLVAKAKEKKDYKFISTITKILMLTGILSTQIFYLQF
jgi:4-hydroxybenzoate polyprenyltransferase